MKAKVDEELCTGCGPCEEICPEVFKIEEDVSIVKTDPVPPEAEESCREAADQCPTDAISVEE